MPLKTKGQKNRKMGHAGNGKACCNNSKKYPCIVNKKKEVEYRYFKSFLFLLRKGQELSDSDIKWGESPDFIINLRDRKIGIEITEHHSSEKDANKRQRRATEEDWELLRNTIMDRVWNDSELCQAHAYLQFRKLELPHRRDFIRFTDELIEISKKMISAGLEVIKLDESYLMLFRYMDRMYLKRVGCFISWDWNHDAGSVGLTEPELIRTIKPKIMKSSKYVQGRTDELWLVVIEGYRLSQAMGIYLERYLSHFLELDSILRQSRFDKVYIYQYMQNVIYEWPGWVKLGEEHFIETV